MAEWIIADVPELRILDDDLWRRVKQRQTAISSKVTPMATRPRHRAPNAPDARPICSLAFLSAAAAAAAAPATR